MKSTAGEKALLFLFGATCPATALYYFLHRPNPSARNPEKTGRKPGEKEEKP